MACVQQASGLDPAENRARLADLVPDDTDLTVLPEAFARDFGPLDGDLAAVAEPLDGAFGQELSRVAGLRRTTVVAGMFEQARPHPFNTLLVRGAATAAYRKIHLYDSFGYRESDRLAAGPPEPVVVEIGGWRVGLQTCYDLRFPELTRRLVDAGAEVLVLPAAWVAGERKVDHWRTLLRARAIESTAYVVAAAQPAPRYCGHSMIVSPLGDVLAEAGDGPDLVRATLDRGLLEEARAVNPSLANRRL